MDSYGEFTRSVKNSLERDARYKGTRLIKTPALADCIELSVANRLDMILFDWTEPSAEEALMVRGERNIFFEMMHGEAQGILSLGDDGVEFDRGDGSHFDQESLRAEAVQLDIRELWMNKVRAACEAEGIEPPPYFIVRSRQEHQDLAKIISQKLGNPLQ